MNEATLVVDRRLNIPRTTLVEPIGQGASGTVWLARRDGVPCVVKLMREDLDALGVHEARFVREARVTALLDHPGVARLLDAGRTSGRFYTVCEFVYGVTLADLGARAYERGEALDAAIVFGVGHQLLASLAYVHDFEGPDGPLRIVHRDLSARNVMVGFDGGVRIIDFGVARAALDDQLTTTGSIFGTPMYMAPEQARGEPTDRRADLYTVAVVLYELLTNRAVASGQGVLEILRSVERDVPPLVSTVRADLEARFDDLFVRALAKDPDDRFQTAAAFLTAIEASVVPAGPAAIVDVLQTAFTPAPAPPAADVVGGPATLLTPVAATVTAGSSTLAAPGMSRSPSRTSWWLALPVLVVAAAALVVVGVRRTAPSPAAPVLETSTPNEAPAVTARESARGARPAVTARQPATTERPAVTAREPSLGVRPTAADSEPAPAPDLPPRGDKSPSRRIRAARADDPAPPSPTPGRESLLRRALKVRADAKDDTLHTRADELILQLVMAKPTRPLDELAREVRALEVALRRPARRHP